MTIDCFFLNPFVDELTKRGRDIWVYVCIYACSYIVYWLFPNPFWCITKRGRSICGFMFWFHVLYMFNSYMFFISFILDNRASFEGEFLPPFYILCYNLYVLSSSKRGRLLAQKVTLSICLCFDDNKTHRRYLVLISCLEWVSGLY